MTTVTQRETGLYKMMEQAPVAMCLVMGSNFVIETVNKKQLELWQKTASEVISQPLFAVFAEVQSQEFKRLLTEVYQTGVPFKAEAIPAQFLRNGTLDTGWFDMMYEPVRNDSGDVEGIVAVSVEVTQQVQLKEAEKQKEAELRKSKEQLELSVNAGRIGLWNWDVASGMFTWSPEQEEIYGLTPGAFGGSMQDFLSFILPEDLPLIEAETAKASAANTDYEVTHRIRRADGEIRWICSRSRNIYNEAGELVQMTGTNVDITEQKNSEEEWRRLQQRLGLARNAANVYYWEIETATGKIHWSENAHEVLGFPAGTMPAFVHEAFSFNLTEDDAAVQAAMQDVLTGKGQKFSFEQRLRHPVTGTEVWVQASGIAEDTQNGKPIRIVGLSQNITERKNTEAELRKGKEKLELSINAGHVGIWHWDAKANKLSWSREQQEIYGLNEGEFGETLEAFHQLVHPEDLQTLGVSAEVQNNQSKEYEYQFRICRKDGELRWISARSRTFFNAAGELEYITGTNVDITERKRAEKTLVKTKQRLEAGVKVANLALAEIDYTTGLVHLSEEAAVLYGLPFGQPITRQQIHASFHEDDRVWLEGLIERCLHPEGDGLMDVEHRVMHPNGEVRWLDVSKKIYFDRTASPARPLYGILAAYDVTNHKKAEQALQKSERHLRLALDSSGMGAWTFDLQSTLENYDAKTLSLFGLDPATFNGEVDSIFKAIVPEDLEVVNKAVEKAIQEKVPYNSEFRVVLQDGSLRWVAGHGQVEYGTDGKPLLLRGVSYDITERKKVEEAVQLNEKKFRNIFETTTTSIWVEDFSLMKAKIEQLKRKGVSDFDAYLTNNPQEYETFAALLRVKDVNEFSLGQFAAASKEELINGLPKIFIPETLGVFNRELQAIADGDEYFEAETEVQDLKGRHMHILFSIHFPVGTDYSHVLVNIVNITSRKIAEEKVKQSEHRYHSLIYSSTNAIAILSGAEMIIEIANDAIIEIWGKGSDVIGKPYLELLPELKEQGIGDMLHGVYATGVPYHAREFCIYMNRFGERELHYYNFVFQPQYNLDNTIEGVAIIAYEVTQQTEQNNRIKESESRFRNIANDAPAFIFMADANAEISYINNTWIKFTGLSEEDALGQGWATITHPDDLQPSFATFNHAFETHTAYQYEMRQRGADGMYHWLLWRGIPQHLPSGEFVGVLGFGFDITERKKAEQIVAESESRFRTLAETLPQMVWMMDADGRVEYGSKSWEAYSGIADVMEAWNSITHPEEKERLDAYWQEVFAERKGYRHEVRLRNKAGEYRWHHSVGEPVKNEQGEVIKWIGSLTDIHDQKIFAEKLEALVAQRTQQLASVNRELARSNEDLQQFAHVSSHDLKEPVRKIITFISLIENEFGDNLPEKAKLYLSKINGASKRSYAMIDGVLQYSMLGTGRYNVEQVDLTGLLQSIEADLEVMITAKDGVVRYTALPVLSGYPTLLHQLFYNLLVNAIKFAKPGVPPQIEISDFAVTDADIQRLQLPPQEYTGIRVKDNGIGFDQKNARQIFQTFTRLHSKDRYEGTGLGLALCKKIVERHGGGIEAEGKEGKGAVFTMFLPAKGKNERIR